MNVPLVSLLRDRRLWTGGLPWFLGLMLVANLGISSWKDELDRARQENLLMYQLAAVRGDEIPRFDWSVGEKIDQFWRHIPDARSTRLVVVSGMSQMYSINDAKRTDRAISELLDDRLAPKGLRVFGLAAPNLNNEEALLYLLAASAREETRPEAFVYGVCFDKFRNVDVRAGLQTLLRRTEVSQAWAAVCAESSAQFPLACAKMKASLASAEEGAKARDSSASNTSGYVSVEERLRAFGGRVMPMVEARQSLNAMAQSEAVNLRNAVFRIKATTKRPLLQSRYQLNQQFLELIIEVARKHGVRLFLYVIPLNPQSENPYVTEQYVAFKRWVEELAAREQVPFANLEGEVRAEDWGLLNGEPDFKHFTGAGHRTTAEAILRELGAKLEAKDRP
ncbi:MAG: hypothetical protein KJ015_19665 [Myxococcales bacterium]|nr:hypothetical protein [Myxococcales bacterium]